MSLQDLTTIDLQNYISRIMKINEGRIPETTLKINEDGKNFRNLLFGTEHLGLVHQKASIQRLEQRE